MAEGRDPNTSIGGSGGGKDGPVVIAIVGSLSCGKSSLLRQLCSGAFSSTEAPTIGIDCKRKALTLHGKEVKVHIWDASGSPMYHDMVSRYIPGKACVLLCCSLASEESFRELLHWKNRVQLEDPVARIGVIATQADKPAAFPAGILEAWCEKEGFPLAQCTATDSGSTQRAFRSLLERLVPASEVLGAGANGGAGGERQPLNPNRTHTSSIAASFRNLKEDIDDCVCKCSIL